MRAISHLPSRADGAQGLLALAENFGPQAVYELILLCRTARGRADGQDPGGEALVALSRQMVEHEMDKANVDYDAARYTVATRLGYLDYGTRSNFYKMLQGGRAPEKRPNSRVRNNASK